MRKALLPMIRLLACAARRRRRGRHHRPRETGRKPVMIALVAPYAPFRRSSAPQEAVADEEPHDVGRAPRAGRQAITHEGRQLAFLGQAVVNAKTGPLFAPMENRQPGSRQAAMKRMCLPLSHGGRAAVIASPSGRAGGDGRGFMKKRLSI